MEANQPAGISLKDILDIIFKRKGKIILFFAATVCIGTSATFLMEPKFEATAQILVKMGRESVFVPAGGDMGPIISLNREERVNSEIEIINSLALAEKLAKTLDPAVLDYRSETKVFKFLNALKLFEIFNASKKKLQKVLGKTEKELSPSEHRLLKFESALAFFKKSLKVESIKNSSVIQISYQHRDPQIAAMIVNKLTELYLEHHVEVHKAPQARDFFQQQAEVLKLKLKQSEEKLKLLKEQYNVSALTEQRSLLLVQESELQAELNETLSQVIETDRRIRQIRRQLAATPKTVLKEEESDQNQNLISTLEARLVELEIEQKKLLTKYTPQSRLVQNVNDEIRVVVDKLSQHTGKHYQRKRSGINTAHQHLQQTLYQYEADLKAFNAKSKIQKTQLEEYQKFLEKLNKVEADLRHLELEVEVNSENYKRYLKKYEETRIDKAMDSEKMTSVNLIEPARVPLRPKSPKTILNIMLAIFFGIFGGFGLALFLEYLDDSLKRPEDVDRYLDLPVLASIPKLKA